MRKTAKRSRKSGKNRRAAFALLNAFIVLTLRDEYIAHVVDKKCPAGVCKSLLSIVIDKDKCIGCGKCAKNCPVDCITKTDYVAPGHKLPSYTIDTSKCIKCGACIAGCKFGAISKK